MRTARNRIADVRVPAQVASTSGEGPLPDFVIVGAMKAGTTSLADNLKRNPAIFMPPREVRFFNQHWHQGIGWYRRHFAEGAGKVCGEKTPEYMRLRRYMDRIHRVLPGAKIIVLLREPVARLMSEINHRISEGSLPATRSIDADYLRRVVLRDPLRRRRTVDRGFYLRQIRRNIAPFFPRERVFIRATDDRAIDRVALREGRRGGRLAGEDPSDHTRRLLHDLCAFLGVDPFAGSEAFTVSGVREYTAPVAGDARKTAYDLYARENERLFEFLGYEIPAWREEMAVGS